MNPLDIGVIGVIGLSAIFAFARGVVREALSIVAWVGAGAATLYGFGWAYGLIEPQVHNVLLSQLIAGFGLFLVTLIVLTILTGLLARLVHASGVSSIDRTLGFVFGLARGAFLVSLAFLMLDVSVPPKDRPAWLRDAKSAPYLNEGANLLRGLLPESLKIKASEVAGAAQHRAGSKESAAAQARDAMRALEKPTPPPASGPAAGDRAAKGYSAGEKKQLDQLFGTQR